MTGSWVHVWPVRGTLAIYLYLMLWSDLVYNNYRVQRNMIYSEHFIKPWCDEHVLVKLLTKAF